MIPKSTPNKAQKDWREWVRETGCCLNYPGPVKVHHIFGREARQNGIKIGHAAVLPVSNEAHRIVETSSLTTQKQLFIELLSRYYRTFYALPDCIDGPTLLAILAYSKTGSRG